MKKKDLVKYKPKNIIRAIKANATNQSSLFVIYNHLTKNWGDALNTYLIRKISGVRPYSTITTLKLPWKKSYTVIGSILSFHNLDGVEVWGTGLISQNSVIKGKPARVHAIRGPLTAKILKAENIECPNIYGDPAITLPLFYRPNRPKSIKKNRLGVILHKGDRNNKRFKKIMNEEGVLNINIYSKTTQFVDDVISCETIASSSLHGLITADSYGIPRTWLHGYPIEKHGRFKFDDYFLGMGFTVKIEPFVGPLNMKSIIENSDKYPHKSELIKKLINSCPFKKHSVTQ